MSTSTSSLAHSSIPSQPFSPLGIEVERVVTKYLTPELLEDRMREFQERQRQQERILLEAVIDEVIEACCESTNEERDARKVLNVVQVR